MWNTTSQIFDRVLNTLLCPSTYHNEIQMSRWLVTFYYLVFIEQASIMQIFLETRNGEILSPKQSTSLITCSESVHRHFLWRFKGIRELFFSYHGSLRVIQRFFRPRTRCAVATSVQGAWYIGASKMHFRCVLRCVCSITHLSSPSLYLDRYAVFIIWFSVWFELFS